VEIVRFDRGEKAVSRHGSVGLAATRVAASEGGCTVTCLAIAPGGLVGTHPASGVQLFLVVAGEGWVAGPDGRRTPLAAGSGVRWQAGEEHTSGSSSGMTAVVIEGTAITLFEPEPSGELG